MKRSITTGSSASALHRAVLTMLVVVPLATIATAQAAAAAATGPASTEPAVHTTRTVVDSNSGEELVITDEGQCGRTRVSEQNASGHGLSDVGVTHTLSYSIDKACKVAVLSGNVSSLDANAGAAAQPATEQLQSAGVRPAGQATAASSAAAASTIYGNIVHGSQTMQDVINVDIAKYRYGHDRVWDNIGYTYFKWDWWMVSSTSVSWNHPTHNPAGDGYDGAWTYYAANGYGHGDFHSDFLWCNFQPGQNFYLDTTLTSYWQGSYDAHFQQSRACSGTHMATAKKADLKLSAW